MINHVLTTLPGAVSVAGYFAPNENNHHAIAAQKDGKIHEIWWWPSTQPSSGVLTTLPGVVSVAGYFNPNDGFHVIAATNDGRSAKSTKLPASTQHLQPDDETTYLGISGSGFSPLRPVHIDYGYQVGNASIANSLDTTADSNGHFAGEKLPSVGAAKHVALRSVPRI